LVDNEKGQKDTSTNNIAEIHNAVAWNKIGKDAHDAGNYTFAIEAFTKSIKLNPLDADIYFCRGEAYCKLNKSKQAIKDYNKSINLDPYEEVVYYRRGLIYRKIGKINKAIEDFSKIIEILPELARTYNDRGICYAKLGEDQKAIEDYTEAIRLKPKYHEAIYNRGLSYGCLKQYQLSTEDFNRVISIKPDHADAFNYRGINYFLIGKKLLGYRDAKKAAALGNRFLLENMKSLNPLIQKEHINSVRFEKILLQNYGIFIGSNEIIFDQNNTFIVGAGKTTIVDALANLGPVSGVKPHRGVDSSEMSVTVTTSGNRELVKKYGSVIFLDVNKMLESSYQETVLTDILNDQNRNAVKDEAREIFRAMLSINSGKIEFHHDLNPNAMPAGERICLGYAYIFAVRKVLKLDLPVVFDSHFGMLDLQLKQVVRTFLKEQHYQQIILGCQDEFNEEDKPHYTLDYIDGYSRARNNI
jgi:tetratricopeptide (TPR) repeat protein